MTAVTRPPRDGPTSRYFIPLKSAGSTPVIIGACRAATIGAGRVAADRVAADRVAADRVAAERVWASGDASTTAARPATIPD